MPSSHARPPRLRDSGGFTLIELLVAITASIVVIGALYSILEFTTTQSVRITNETSADQLGRTAIAQVLEELHSACIAPSFDPVQTGSTPDELLFVSGYGREAALSRASLNRIVWDPKAQTLTSYVYESNGGEWPHFTYPALSSPTTRTLLASDVTQVRSGGEAEPVFRYYRYATAATGGEVATAAVSTLQSTPLNTPLSEEAAAEAASVLITFNAAATQAGATLEHSIALRSRVTFALSVPNSETPIHDAPCQ